MKKETYGPVCWEPIWHIANITYAQATSNAHPPTVSHCIRFAMEFWTVLRQKTRLIVRLAWYAQVFSDVDLVGVCILTITVMVKFSVVLRLRMNFCVLLYTVLKIVLVEALPSYVRIPVI